MGPILFQLIITISFVSKPRVLLKKRSRNTAVIQHQHSFPLSHIKVNTILFLFTHAQTVESKINAFSIKKLLLTEGFLKGPRGFGDSRRCNGYCSRVLSLFHLLSLQRKNYCELVERATKPMKFYVSKMRSTPCETVSDGRKIVLRHGTATEEVTYFYFVAPRHLIGTTNINIWARKSGYVQRVEVLHDTLDS